MHVMHEVRKESSVRGLKGPFSHLLLVTFLWPIMIYVGRNKYTHRSCRYIGGSKTVMGYLHDDVILLLRPESFRGCFFVKFRLLTLKTHWDYQI